MPSVYGQPGSQEGSLNKFEHSLLSLQSNGSCPRVILTGDFNVPDIMWEQLFPPSNPQYGLSLYQKMLSTVDNSGLTQLVTFPTRGESILDLVLSNHSIQWYPNLNLSIKLNKKEPRFEYKFNNADFNDVIKNGYNKA